MTWKTLFQRQPEPKPRPDLVVGPIVVDSFEDVGLKKGEWTELTINVSLRKVCGGGWMAAGLKIYDRTIPPEDIPRDSEVFISDEVECMCSFF